MDPALPSRREFVLSSTRLLGGGWMALALPALSSLSACAKDAARSGAPLTVLTPAEGRTFAALADRILPSDDLPGAEEAGVLHFADLGLGSFFETMREPVRDGLADLDRRARTLDATAAGFADLAPERQDEVLRAVETTPFFDVARMLVLAGTFSDPSYGGNRDGAGWRLLGVEHRGSYQPPFGWYDEEYPRERKGGAA
jgi:gluconate 2-dehydrogenase gamma chain